MNKQERKDAARKALAERWYGVDVLAWRQERIETGRDPDIGTGLFSDTAPLPLPRAKVAYVEDCEMILESHDEQSRFCT